MKISSRNSIQAHRAPLSRNCSVLLDVMRFTAALTVFLGHLGEVGFSTGLPYLAGEAHLAVAVFFTLSGFVIRYVTLSRETTPGEYLLDRATRIYSVVAPALAITIVCELAARAIRPEYYAFLRLPFLWRDVPLQLAANLTFMAQNWGYAIYPLSNDPFWSLSFECLYYAVYGLIFFRLRYGLAFSCLLFALGGPSILLMFPVWLLGCLAYDLYSRCHANKRASVWLSIAFTGLILLAVVARHPVLWVLAHTKEPARTAWITQQSLKVPLHRLFFYHGSVPWLVQATPSYYVAGIATAILIVWVALAMEHLKIKVPSQIANRIRTVADSTFALYLLHLPLLILLVCVLGRRLNRASAPLACGFIILVCIGCGTVFDRLKNWLRGLAKNSFQPECEQ